MSDELLIQANGLHRHYGSQHAVNNVTIHLRRGEVLGLLGPNGAGKSTTMNMLTGNLAPGSGEIRINGIDLLDSPRQAKQHIGYLPEQPPVYRDMSVLEYLQYCAALKHIPRKKTASSIATALKHCGLLEVKKRLIGNLSKGFQQRVGIAQAIVNQPQVIILDEPTVGLDPVQIREIRSLIRELGNQHGVILSTHILPEVQAVCDRVQIINEGKTVFEDKLDNLSSHRPRYDVSFDRPVEQQRLAELQPVAAVTMISANSFELEFSDVTAGIQAINRLAVERKCHITRLNPASANLESIFLELVHGGEDVA